MTMTSSQALEAAEEARITLLRADIMLRKTSRLLCKRLQVTGIDHTTLCLLKKELEMYNMHTGQWKK